MTPLEDLLQQCTVKITVPGSWGTGFFVASGLVLTCAHVVRRAVDSPITVFYAARGVSLSAIAMDSADDGQTLDLALLKLSEPLLDHPCVFLDEEPVAIGQELYSYGYLKSYPHAAPVRPIHEGWTGDNPPLLKLQGAQIEVGISGAALLNLRTGKVCGMVKETRAAGFDLGGGAIPTRVILEQFPELRELQRAFHESDRRWVNLITPPGIDFQPYLQAILADDDYREWQEIYTPTTVEDRRREPVQETTIASQRRFSSRLKLRAEIVKPDKQGQGNQPDRVQEPQERVEQWDVLAGLRNYATEHVVLIGKPGSGKSTSLERLLWEEAEKALHDPKARIPVLVKLRRCTGTIEALIRDFLLGHQVVLEMAQVKELLRQGKFLLLLDGLNELPKDFEIEIANFRDRYRRTTPMIVSTRDLSAGGTLGIEKTLKMLPLTEPQMREFVRGYLGEEGDRLFQQLQGDRLRKFAETPLLLWMLCRVFAHNGKVPDNLGFAFREFTQLHDQELQADAPADSKDQWHKLLRHLAFVMMQGKTLTDPELSIPREEAEDCLTAYLRQEDRSNPRDCAERWLQDLLQYHLIQPVIQPNLEEHIEFRHQLIQEYYAAEYLLKLLPTLTNEQLQQDYLNYLKKWTEPVALMLALVPDEALAVRVVEQALEVDLMLGARLAGEVEPKFQSQTVTLLKKQQIPELVKIHFLGATRSTNVTSDLVHALLKHENLTLSTDAALMLSHLGDPLLVDKLINLLAHDNYIVRANAAFAALGLRGMDNDRIVLKLAEALQDKHEHEYFRESAARTLGVLGNSKATPALISALRDSSMHVREKAIEGLSNLNDQTAFASLFKIALEDQFPVIRWSAARALGRIDSKTAMQKLLKVLENEDWEMGKRAADAIEHLESEEVISTLVELLENHNKYRYSYVYSNAAKGLKNIGTEKAVQGLIQALQHPDFEICSAAINALGNLGNQTVIPKLAKMLENPNPDIREETAFALGKLGSKDAISELISFFIEKQNRMVRGRTGADAARLLGILGDKIAIPPLSKAIRESKFQNSRPTGIVIGVLGKLGCEEIIPELFKRLEEDKSWTQNEVIDGLASLNNQVIRSRACQLLENSDRELRIVAAKVLGRMGDIATIEHLRKALRDPDLEVRLYVVDALGAFCDCVSLSHLWQLQLLEETDTSLLSTIKSIQSRCKFYNYEIWQAHLAARKGDRPANQIDKTTANTITIQTVEKLTLMSDKAPIFNQQNATIGVNYAAEGSQQDFTQHIYAPEQNFEILLTGYKHFIDELQQQNPYVTDETAIIQTIDIEARRIDTRWQNFLNLQRLWNGGKKAAIKVGEHFVESNPWGKGAIAFLEGVSEDVK